MKVDILVIAAHPDDAELGCGGTIARHVDKGYKVGIVDLTRGELGTRGDPELRAHEAAAAASILGVVSRVNLEMKDGFFSNDESHQLRLVQAIRNFSPRIVLAPAIRDRHPDHGRASQLAVVSCFLSGLGKIHTKDAEGKEQIHWRPAHVYHYIQSQHISPDLIVDVSGYWAKKEQAIKAYKSQMYDPTSTEPETFISRPVFLEMIRSRAIDFGVAIGTAYGEGFTTLRPPAVEDLSSLI